MATAYEVDVWVGSPEAVTRVGDVERELGARLPRECFQVADRSGASPGRGLAIAVRLDADDASLAGRDARDLVLRACRSAGVEDVGPDLDVVVRSSS